MDGWIRRVALRMWCLFGWHTWKTVDKLRGNEEGMVIQRCIGCQTMRKIRDRSE